MFAPKVFPPYLNSKAPSRAIPSPVASPPIDQPTPTLLLDSQIPSSWSTRTTTILSYLRKSHVGISFLSRHVLTSNLALVKATCITYPLTIVLSYDRLSPKYHAFTTSLLVKKEPSSFAQVVCDPKWCLAM